MIQHDDDEDTGILPKPVEGTPADIKRREKDEMMRKIQDVLNGDRSKQNEQELLKLVQMNRRLMLDIATETFISKPNNPKLLDSINTLLAGLEKSVRDDRKEALKDRELEDNKANFGKFVNALNEITAGRLKMPTGKTNSGLVLLDPLKPIANLDDRERIKEEELDQGRQTLDHKAIADSFDD